MNFQELLDKYNLPELAEASAESNMVWQVWDDGEGTLQKNGDLLWQRNLHTIYSALSSEPITTLPLKYGKHTYIFTNEEGVKALREYFQQTLNN